jgi:putative membrane protein
MSHMKKIGCTIAIGALALIGAGTARAQQENDPQQSSPQATGNESMRHGAGTVHMMSDKEFARKAAEGGLAEVKLGQLAEEKAESPTVKDFGKRMVEDHSKANDELKDAAARENITLPDKLDPQDQATYEQLSKLSGAQFDKAYARDMVKDHRADIAEFKQEAQNGKDEAIKNFASQTVPTLEEHLKLAHQMFESVSGSTGTPSGTSR